MIRRTRLRKILLALAVALAIGAAGARAIAHRRGGHMKAMVSAHIDQALDAAKATGPQKAAVYAARDHLFDAFAAAHKPDHAQLEQALVMFQGDKIDRAKIDEIRARHEGDAKKVGDAFVQALSDTHDALTQAQRRAVVDYIKANHKPGNDKAGLRKAFFKHLIENRIDDALAHISATPKQRQVVTDAKDKVIAAAEQMHQGRGTDLERALELFVADKLDTGAIDALRAKHQAGMKAMVDTVVQSVIDVHGALSAGQRTLLTDYIRSHKRHG
jgi:hypothetical protein